MEPNLEGMAALAIVIIGTLIFVVIVAVIKLALGDYSDPYIDR